MVKTDVLVMMIDKDGVINLHFFIKTVNFT